MVHLDSSEFGNTLGFALHDISPYSATLFCHGLDSGYSPAKTDYVDTADSVCYAKPVIVHPFILFVQGDRLEVTSSILFGAVDRHLHGQS